MFGEHFLEILELKLVLLDTLALNNEDVFFGFNIWDSQVIADVEQLVGGDVILGQQVNTGFTAPWLDCTREIVWIAVMMTILSFKIELVKSHHVDEYGGCSKHVPNRISLKHVTKLKIASLLRIFWRKVTDTVLFHPCDDMPTKVLAIDFPIWFQVLSSSHQQTLERDG